MHAPDAKHRRVLVVEDDPLNMRLFTAMLVAQGHHVLQATDGASGVDIAHREHPDLIIMDVQMPGISGLEATHSLKTNADTRDIPVIITTAYLLDDEEIRASGCNGYLAKPITISEFLKAIELIIAQSARLPADVG